jgi:hypothetical protein
MNLSVAGLECKRCAEAKTQQASDNYLRNYAKAVDSFLVYQYQEFENDMMSDENFKSILVFVRRLQNFCFHCERKEPLGYNFIRDEFIDPFNEIIEKAIAENNNGGKKRKKKSKIVYKLDDFRKRE